MSEQSGNYIRWAIASSFCFLIVHLMLIFRFAPFGDEVWDLSGECWGIYLAGGRYTVTLMRALFSHCGVPVAYGIAASVYFGLAVTLQMKILRIDCVWNRLVYLAFSVGVIQISYLMINAFIADAVCFGLFASTLAYWLADSALKEKRWALFGLSVLMGVLGLGAYQLLAMLLPCLFLAQMLAGRSDLQGTSVTPILKRGLYFAMWCVLVVICNLFVAHCSKMLCCAEDLTITGGYQASLITWGQLDLCTHVLHIGKQWVMHLVGCAYPGEWVYVTALVALCLVLVDVWKKYNTNGLRWLHAIAAISLYVLPFLPIAAMGEDQGARLFLAQPLSCASLWSIALSSRIKRWPESIVGVMCLFVVLQAVYGVSSIAYYQKRMYEQSVAARTEMIMLARHTPVPEGVDVRDCPIVVKGKLRLSLYREDKYNSCIPSAGDAYLEQFLGGRILKQANSEDKEQKAVFEGMPVYPAAGSMRYHGGAILVKLS